MLTGNQNGCDFSMRIRRPERHELLRDLLKVHPFYTDEELAERLDVSVSTIRLDRTELGIPEMRERTRVVAHEAYGKLRSLKEQELIGELKKLTVGEYARSELIIKEDMVLEKAQVARGHYLFAQANSLAMALVDAEIALTGSADIRYRRPVKLGERVVAIGKVLNQQENRYIVEISGKVDNESVFEGRWVLFAVFSG